MINEATVFPKQIKLDDYEQQLEGNLLTILQSSNLLLGSGARTSSAAVVLAKCLQYMHQQGLIALKSKKVLELGCGVGMLGIYLACLGSNVLMSDVSVLKDLVERNININRKMLKGNPEFVVINWKNDRNGSICDKGNAMQQESQQFYSQHVIDMLGQIDLTIICQCGSLSQLPLQFKWMGKQGIIICFTQHSHEYNEDELTRRRIQEYLLKSSLYYDKIDSYHPDYVDERVNIYRIWK